MPSQNEAKSRILSNNEVKFVHGTRNSRESRFSCEAHGTMLFWSHMQTPHQPASQGPVIMLHLSIKICISHLNTASADLGEALGDCTPPPPRPPNFEDKIFAAVATPQHEVGKISPPPPLHKF